MIFKNMKYLIQLFILISFPLLLNAGEIGDKWSNNPTITVTDTIEVTEGNSGTKSVEVTVSIDKCPNRANIYLDYSTQDDSATTADNDYQSKSGTITFNVGSCTKTQTFNITINGDTKVEDDEHFLINYTKSTMPFQKVHFNNGRDVTNIYINNDDGVTLDAGKYLIVDGEELDYARYQLNDTITFRIYAQNQGPNPSTIKMTDDLPSGVELIPNSIQIVNNVDNYSCSANGNSVICSGSHIFEPNSEAKITFKAKATTEGSFTNYAYITDNDGNYRNGDHVDFDVVNEGDGVAIEKTVDKTTAQLGDRVNFTVTVTNNTPEDRILEFRDWFPKTDDGESYSGTTKNAFKNVSLPTIISDPTNSTTCNWDTDDLGRKFIFCSNSQKLKPGESFKLKFGANVVKVGNICNTGHAYLEGWIWMSESRACLSVGGNHPPVISNLHNKAAYIGENFSYKLKNKISDPDGDPLTITVSGLPDGFVYDKNKKKIYAKPVTANEGVYTVTVSVTDDPSSHNGTPVTVSKTFKIRVKYKKVKARPNDYEIGMNETLEGNVITDDTGKGKDKGYGLKISNYHFITPVHGQFSLDTNGKFRYKPDQDYKGVVKFNYTITDIKGRSDTALVTITVKTQFSSKFEDFKLINPLETRNIIGNYVIAGNTVECVTNKTDSFNGTCQNDRLEYYNNHYIVKYIDIDNSSKTWNSSSASFTLPDSYMPSSDGKNIVWAGLFWQGNVNNINNFSKNGELYQNIQRRSYSNGNGNVATKDINQNEVLDILNTSANKVLVKIDNENSYHEIEASRFYYDNGDYGDDGATYAAYADITNLLQSKKLNKGKHTITVANILTNEGLEWLNGDYGGWSIVVIYKEDFINGRARNISIYNGFTAIDGTTHGSQQVKISGFKLPKEGTVNSQFSVFAGEGELKYGDPYIDPDTNKTMYDTMRLKRLVNEDGDIMPGADNPNNIFDAKLANIQRDSGKNNDIENTNGIDIDTYDVSNIMTKYRDLDNNISSVYVYIDSNKDYITPSMIAFATELYAPKVCYDSDVKIGKYIDVDVNDRNFSAYNYNKPLQMKVMIRSQEADFDLIDTKLRVDFEPNDVFNYIPGNSKTSYPNTYEYHDAIDTDTTIGEIAIGHSPNTNGGILKAKELVYSKMYYNFNKDYFEGKFDVVVDAKVSFDGVHKVEYQLSTKAPEGSIFNIQQCSPNPVYSPVYGMFNVERGDSTFTQNKAERYSLYTQVVGVPYQVSVAAYKKDANGEFNKQAKFSGTVELELIDASTFENNRSIGFDSICQDPDTYNIGKFVHFENNASRVKVNIPDDFPKLNGKTTYPENLALKNAAFRVWVLTKKDANSSKRVVVSHQCSSQFDSSCFENLYNQYYADTNKCNSECGAGSSGKSCYECLRKNFATPICSRDNFAIRPVSYDINIADDNETHSTVNKVNIAKNDSLNSIDLAAGYLYHLDINATKFSTTREKADGYYLNVFGDKGSKKSIALFNDSSSCFDRNNSSVKIHLFNGTTLGYESLSKNPTAPLNGLIINNSGKYKYHIEDSSWTRVDQKGYKYKPFKNYADCIDGSIEIKNGELNAKRGCLIESNDTINGYYDLHLNMHPYSFNLTSLNAVANPDTGADFIYINDINDTRNLIIDQSVMAMNIKGSITAIGKNGVTLSNYTNSCSANNLNVKINYDTLKENTSTIIKDIIGNNVNMLYTLYNPNIDSNITILKSLSKEININYNKRYFDDNNTTVALGSSMFNAYLNFERSFNGAINPFKLIFGNFKVTSVLDKSNVDLSSNHIPNAIKDLNSSKMVYYAKVKSKSDFYDDVYESSINTPIMVTVFCNETLDKCQKYGIDTQNDTTNEYDWWIFKSHNALDGKAILSVGNTNKVSITPNTIEDFVDGVDKDVVVRDEGLVTKPFTAIIVPTIDMISNYPWLLFNSFEDKVPSYIYKVRFVNPTSAWSGEGKTGHTIDVNSNGRKSNKVSW